MNEPTLNDLGFTIVAMQLAVRTTELTINEPTLDDFIIVAMRLAVRMTELTQCRW